MCIVAIHSNCLESLICQDLQFVPVSSIVRRLKIVPNCWIQLFSSLVSKYFYILVELFDLMHFIVIESPPPHLLIVKESTPRDYQELGSPE